MLKINQDQIIKHFNKVTLYDVLSAMEAKTLIPVDMDEENMLLEFKFTDVVRNFGVPKTHDILFELIEIETENKRKQESVKFDDGKTVEELKNVINLHEISLNHNIGNLKVYDIDTLEQCVADLISLSANLNVMTEKLDRKYGV